MTQRKGGIASYPFTPGGFVTAVGWGDLEAVQAFLERGMDINAADADGNTGLHVAADKKDEVMVRFLIVAGADPNLQDDRGNSPLMLAAANNDPRIASLLLEAGADPFLRNAAGETAADIAKNLGNQEVLAVLPRR